MRDQAPHRRMYDRTRKPKDSDIINFISDSDAIASWKQIQEYLKAHYDLLMETIYYGDRYGWVVRFRKSGRTIVSLFPEKNSFSFLIVYGKKEIDKFSSQESEFLPAIVEVFKTTKKLHDGKWLWIQVIDSTYFENLKKLIAIKRKPKKLK